MELQQYRIRDNATVLVAGLGLMGGSLCRALKARGYGGRVLGWARRKQLVDAVEAEGICDEASTRMEVLLPQAEVLVVCLPVRRIQSFVLAHLAQFSSGLLVTDVGSTKACLHETLEEPLAGVGCFFAGSHPIAGSEKTGLEASGADLYEGAACVLTHSETTDGNALEILTRLWQFVGCRVQVMDAVMHDQILARTSHLPHLASAALARVAARDALQLIHGSGYRDMTRLAAGSVAVWQDIVSTNRTAILTELDALCMDLTALREDIAADNEQAVADWLQVASDRRKHVLEMDNE